MVLASIVLLVVARVRPRALLSVLSGHVCVCIRARLLFPEFLVIMKFGGLQLGTPVFSHHQINESICLTRRSRSCSVCTATYLRKNILYIVTCRQTLVRSLRGKILGHNSLAE